MAFEVGQMIVCVDAKNIDPYGVEVFIQEGRIYTVREICVCDYDAVMRLEEVVNPRAVFGDGLKECSWLSRRFRPVRHTDISIFTEALTKLP